MNFLRIFSKRGETRRKKNDQTASERRKYQRGSRSEEIILIPQEKEHLTGLLSCETRTVDKPLVSLVIIEYSYLV